MEKLPTLRTVTEVHYRHRYIRDLLVPVNGFVDQGVRKGRDDENIETWTSFNFQLSNNRAL